MHTKGSQSPVQLHLVLGSMGSGKSTLARLLGGYDTDDAQHDTPMLDSILRPLRDAKAWTVHNNIWFSMIWGGLSTFVKMTKSKTVLLFDHGGWFLLDLPAETVRPYYHVKTVTMLDVSLRTVLLRLNKRHVDRVPNRVLNLARHSHGSLLRAYDSWKGILPVDSCHVVSNEGLLADTVKALAGFTGLPLEAGPVSEGERQPPEGQV